jgi:nicotinate-nucleotide adenylyltransferase
MAALSVTRIGFFGGSFNPPHLAHQMVCVYALATGEIDEVWMAPAFVHPFGKALAPFEDRLRMCELAAHIFAQVRVIPIEREISTQTGRTLDTLKELVARHPEASFRLIIGSDILAETASWHRWEEVTRLAPPLVVPRIPEFSSTAVRETLAEQGNALPLAPRAVLDYIARRGLYA